MAAAELPDRSDGDAPPLGLAARISKLELSATLALVGLLALGLFAWAVYSAMCQYRDGLLAESILQSVAEGQSGGVESGPQGLLRADVGRVGGAWQVAGHEAYRDRLNPTLAEAGHELPIAGVSHGPADSIAWAVVPRPGGGAALFAHEVAVSTAEIWLALGLPFVVAGVMVLWVMVWSGYSVGALMERTWQQNQLLVERSEALTKARDDAQAASAEKASLLANMSHEIRTPMTGVLGLSELLLRGDIEAEDRQHVEQIQQSASSLVAIINDILDFSKLEAGRVSLKPAPVQVRTAVGRSLAGLVVEAREKGLLFSIDVDPDVPPWIELDALRLGQVLLNLAGNAVKFTDEGEVRVAVTSRADCDGLVLKIEVTDTGDGISVEDQAQIFEHFSQGSAGGERGTGTGLGLTITRQLVDLMRGELRLESTVGQGSTFWIELPTRVVDAPAVQPQGHVQVDASLSVLVVEDHELNRKILCRMLETLGLAPSVACNGREAVAAVSEGRFDLVLMDCRMPVMDGLEAARAIRAAEADGSSRVRIVALTGNTSAEDLDACRRAGMDGMVPKPVALEDLRALLAEISARERA